jgi:hypothetical protein
MVAKGMSGKAGGMPGTRNKAKAKMKEERKKQWRT